LLELDIPQMQLAVREYTDSVIAVEHYSAIERAIEGDTTKDALLVTVASMENLRRAYPNYFFDTREFVAAVEDVLN
jgi:hypothetical protein